MVKKKPDMSNMFFYLETDAHEQLKIAAAKRKEPMAEILRGLVHKWLREQASPQKGKAA